MGFGGSGNTASSLASALATTINQGSVAGVTATYNASTPTQLTLNISEAAFYGNYVITGNISNGGAFPTPSFSFATPGGVGATKTNVAAVTDTGILTATINGVSASYQWGPNDTPSTVQSGLINAIGKAQWASSTI